MSIQQAVLAAGVPEVIATTWKIDSEEVIPQLKTLLNMQLNLNELALIIKDIQTKSIQNLSEDSYYKKPHPFFWGNFSLYNLISI